VEKLRAPAHIFRYASTLGISKGGFSVAIWWITTIAFVLCLGFAGGVFIHFLRQGLDTDDPNRIDKINSDQESM
jgi:hypothetical protein